MPNEPNIIQYIHYGLRSGDGKRTGGVVGREKFWTISYANDIALKARSEQELKGMM